jgi:CheY-like chemotaxis protein
MHCVSTGGGEHILLVDDEPMLVETGKKTLSRLGYVVTAETSSVAALELFKKEPYRFDLVFTDQTMPVMTGVDLAKSMLAIRPDIPIILCTGYSNLIDETEARNLGIRALAMKPLMKQEVSVLIQAALEGA